MGNKLRAELGVHLMWSKEEITIYLKRRRKELGAVYMANNISVTNPADRARYLDKKLDIDDEILENSFLEISKSRGKGRALVALEEYAMEKYF